jgi:hypothetical protein
MIMILKELFPNKNDFITTFQVTKADRDTKNSPGLMRGYLTQIEKFDQGNLLKNTNTQNTNFFERSLLTLIISHIFFHTSGNRMLVSTLCVKCGTLFLDDFHIFSSVIVGIKIAYPYIICSILNYINESYVFEHNFKVFMASVCKENTEKGKGNGQDELEPAAHLETFMVMVKTEDMDLMRAFRLQDF